MVWVWITVLAAVVFSSAVVWIHERQQQFMNHFAQEQTILRHARIDLTTGYLHASMASLPQSPFDRTQGLAQLDQAVSSLERALQLQQKFEGEKTTALAGDTSHSPIADFAYGVTQFRGMLTSAQSSADRTPAYDAQLRIAFFALERKAGALESRIQLDLSRLMQRYDQYSAIILWGSGVLLTIICAVIYAGGRARKQAEEALLASERKYRAFIENSLDAILLTTPDGSILFANPEACKMFDASEQDLIRIGRSGAVDPEDPRLPGLLAERTRKGKARGELTFVRPDGSRFPGEISSALFTDHEGRLLTSVIIRDVTERKLAEEMLRRSEHNLAEAERIGHTGSWEYDVASDTAAWSENMFRIFEVDPASPRELVFKHFVDSLVHPDDRSHVLSVMQDALLGKRPYDLEYRIVKKNGSPAYIHALAEILRDEQGRAIRVIGMVQDITERKKGEKALSESTEQLKFALSGTNDGIWDVNMDSGAVYLSPRGCEILGYSADELQKIIDQWSQLVHPADLPATNAALSAYLEGRSPIFMIEQRLRTSTGDWKWILARGKVVSFDSNGKPMRMVGTHTDISARKRAENVLRDSEERYRSLFENMLNGFAYCRMLYDDNGPTDFVYLDVNRAFESLTGLTNVVGRKASEVIPGIRESDASLIEVYGRVASTGKPETFEVFVKSLDDWYSISVYSPKKGFFVAVFDVITERKKQELVLRRSRELLDIIGQIANVGSWELNLETQTLSGSEETYRIFEVAHDAPLNLDDAINFCVPESRPILAAALQASIDSGTPWDLEIQCITKQGRHLWIRAQGAADRRGDRAVRIYGTLQDITERRKSIVKIQEQARLLDEAGDVISLRDLHHNILYWNKSAERMFGQSAQEVIGKDIREVLYKDNIAEYNASFEALLEKGVHETEFRYTKDGREQIANMRLTIIRDSSGNPESVLSISTDITEKKKLEAQFLRAQRLESIGMLAGGVAHDLNNVLSPILLAVEILKRSAANESSRNMLETLKTSALRGSNIVKQVLSFARGIEGERAVLQVRHIIKETISIAAETFPKSISINEDIPKNLWTILGDATQLHQLLMNLCVNARDAMPYGGTLVLSAENRIIDEQYARMHIEAKPGNYLMISVEDTGTGMTPEVRDHIFEPFFTTKEQGKGTGLGLSTAYTIVKSHGGFINVYSEVGKGTAFKIYLPASASTQEATGTTDRPSYPTGNGEVVLVVDDEASILQITVQTLEAFGYHAISASDGTEALALYASRGKEIALVLTDMIMPIMDGSRTIRALRKMNPLVKIIGSSGLGESSHTATSADSSADAFITKPYTAEKLLRVIHQVLHGPTRPVVPNTG